MKSLKLILGITLSTLCLGGAVAFAAANNVETKEIKPAEAASYPLKTYQGHMLFRKYNDGSWANGWNKSGAKTAVKFFDNYNHDCWSKIVDTTNDVFKGTSDYVDYFVYPESTEHEWTKFQFCRIDSSATSQPWNHVWTWGPIKDLSTSHNSYGPYDASSTTDVSYNTLDVDSQITSENQTIYIRDTDGGAWVADNHHIQVHLWGNSKQGGSRYIDATKVEGDFSDSLNDPVKSLYEAVIPKGIGGYKWFQIKRINAGGSAVNQSNDFEINTSKNVFEYNGTGWSGGIMDGSFKWNIADAGRVNIFSRYIVKETASRCTPQYYDVNTAATFSTAWGNFQTQYEGMSETNQYTFYNTDASDPSSYPAKGADRYDYLVWKYKLNDFVKRSQNSKSAYGARILIPFKTTNNQGVVIFAILTVLIGAATAGYYIFKKSKKKNMN